MVGIGRLFQKIKNKLKWSAYSQLLVGVGRHWSAEGSFRSALVGRRAVFGRHWSAGGQFSVSIGRYWSALVGVHSRGPLLDLFVVTDGRLYTLLYYLLISKTMERV